MTAANKSSGEKMSNKTDLQKGSIVLPEILIISR